MAKSKGFKRPQRTVVVEFDEGTDWYGAEVVCRRDISLGQLRRYEEAEGAGLKGQEDIIRDFVDEVVVSWNLEDDEGEPLPKTGDSLLAWPFEFTALLLRNWLIGATQVGLPLGEPSANGRQLEAVLSETTEAS